MKPQIILASNSPRRKELLMGLGADIKIITSDVDEKVDGSPPPQMLVQQLALLKGAAVARSVGAGLVLSADTVVFLDGEILGKPEDAAQAKQMLRRLSGKTHEVYTGICIIDAKTGRSVTDYEVTKVRFCPLEEEEIDRYVASGEPMDKAGGYGIQGKGSLFVSGIEGDYFNVVGLPLAKLNALLKNEFEINLL